MTSYMCRISCRCRTSWVVAVLLIAVSFGAAPVTVQAQDTVATATRDRFPIALPGQTQQITLRDGTVLFGRIVGTGPGSVHVEATVGTLDIPVANIADVRFVSGDMHGGEYWPVNPNATRLLFAPTAKMLKRGETYFADYYIFFPGFAVGVTDWFSIGGGLSAVPGIGLDKELFYLTPKVRLYSHNNVDVAAGVLAVRVPGCCSDTESLNTFGLYYAAGTYGSADASVTAGLGYGFAGSHVASQPVLMLGGERRLSKHIGIVSENYLVAVSSVQLLSGGVRFFGDKITVDLAVFRPIGSGTSSVGIGLPYLDFMYHF